MQCLVDRDCPQTVVDQIYKQGDEATLYHLAYNGVVPENMPEDLLIRLSEHELPTLRALAATAPNLPLYLMSRLARDISPMVRKALANSPSASPSVLDLLSSDSCADVRNIAIKNAARIKTESKAREAQEAPKQLELFSEEEVAEETNTEAPSEPQAEAPAEEATEPEDGSLFKRLIKRMKGKKGKKE